MQPAAPFQPRHRKYLSHQTPLPLFVSPQLRSVYETQTIGSDLIWRSAALIIMMNLPPSQCICVCVCVYTLFTIPYQWCFSTVTGSAVSQPWNNRAPKVQYVGFSGINGYKYNNIISIQYIFFYISCCRTRHNVTTGFYSSPEWTNQTLALARLCAQLARI